MISVTTRRGIKEGKRLIENSRKKIAILALAAVLVTTFMATAVQPAAARDSIVSEIDMYGAYGKITVSFTMVGGYEKVQVKFEWNLHSPDLGWIQQVKLVIYSVDHGSTELSLTEATLQWFFIWPYWTGTTTGTYTYGPYYYAAGNYEASIDWGIHGWPSQPPGTIVYLPDIWPVAHFYTSGGPYQ